MNRALRRFALTRRQAYVAAYAVSADQLRCKL